MSEDEGKNLASERFSEIGMRLVREQLLAEPYFKLDSKGDNFEEIVVVVNRLKVKELAEKLNKTTENKVSESRILDLLVDLIKGEIGKHLYLTR